uniref:SET domain-containing protein n=1 Tax=Globodera rostochiensis TaxID=31243 RepID=A0A914GY68_GLORO
MEPQQHSGINWWKSRTDAFNSKMKQDKRTENDKEIEFLGMTPSSHREDVVHGSANACISNHSPFSAAVPISFQQQNSKSAVVAQRLAEAERHVLSLRRQLKQQQRQEAQMARRNAELYKKSDGQEMESAKQLNNNGGCQFWISMGRAGDVHFVLFWSSELEKDDQLLVPFSKVKGQRISPPKRTKVQLQLCMFNEDVATFVFMNPAHSQEQLFAERDLVKEMLQQALVRHRQLVNQMAQQSAKGGTDREREAKQHILQQNTHLWDMYKHLVASKVITPQDFWSFHYKTDDKDTNGTDANGEQQRVGVSAGFLSSIVQSEGINGIRLNLTTETIQAIFRTYPAAFRSNFSPWLHRCQAVVGTTTPNGCWRRRQRRTRNDDGLAKRQRGQRQHKMETCKGMVNTNKSVHRRPRTMYSTWKATNLRSWTLSGTISASWPLTMCPNILPRRRSGSSAPCEARQRQVRQHAEANAIMRDAWEEGSTFDDDERLIELLDNNNLHGNEITLKNICDLHRKIAGNTYWAGKFRECNVSVGDFLIPTGPAEVPGKMRDLVVWINEQDKLNRQGQGMGIIWLATHAMHKLNCKCAWNPEQCANRQIQYGVRQPSRTKIASCANGKCVGVFDSALIETGRFVVEYVGEVIGEEEARTASDWHGGCARAQLLFTIREFIRGECRSTLVDARHKGNISWFINHSCEPNLALPVVRLGRQCPSLSMFASRDIQTAGWLAPSGMGKSCRTATASWPVRMLHCPEKPVCAVRPPAWDCFRQRPQFDACHHAGPDGIAEPETDRVQTHDSSGDDQITFSEFLLSARKFLER